MSSSLNSIISSLNSTISSFDSVDRSLNNSFDTEPIVDATDSIIDFGNQVEGVENNIDSARSSLVLFINNTNNMHSNIDRSVRSTNSLRTATDGIGSEINQNISLQNRFNSSLQTGNNYLSNSLSSLKAMITTYASLQGAKALINLSDTSVQNTARLNNMNNTLGDGQYSTAELEELIFNTAQRVGTDYSDMVSLVSRFGNNASDAFGSSAEVVAFTDLLNKQLFIDGAGAEEAKSATVQLTQALGAGVLQGEELNSILDATPNFVERIANQMGVTKGEIKGLASEGLITADIITAALFNSADEINTLFEDIPTTWNQVWTRMQNQALVSLEPVLQKLSDIANSEKFQIFTNNLATGISHVANALVYALDYAISFANVIAENWGSILPVVTGIAGAILVYNGALQIATIMNNVLYGSQIALNAIMLIGKGIWWALGATILAVKGIMYAFHIVNLLMQGGMTLLGLVTNSLSASMLTFNITLTGVLKTMATGLVFILKFVLGVALIGAVIGYIVYKTIDWGDTTTSTLSKICGAIFTAGAYILNIFISLVNGVITLFVGLWNLVAGFVNFFGTAFNDPIQKIAHAFKGLFSFLSNGLLAIANILDTIFGGNLSGLVSSFQSKINSMTSNLISESTVIMDYKDASDFTFDKIDLDSAWGKGVAFGEGLENFGKNLFDNDIPIDFCDGFDYSDFGDFSNLGALDTDALGGDVGNIAGSTSDIADSLSISEEDLKYLRDLAEQEAVNRFTTAEIKVDMGGITNNVSKDTDLDGIVNALTIKVSESMEKMAEGVHA